MRFSLPLASAALLLAAVPLAQAPATLASEGRVVDQLGDPVPAATVEAHANGRVVARTVADGDGVYLLRVPAGGAELRVQAEGKAMSRLPWRGPTTPRVRNAMLEDGGTVRGRVVTADGAPAANANVVAVAGSTFVCATADRDGAFVLPLLPLRCALVRAVTGKSWVERSVQVTADTRCDLELPAAGRQPCLVAVGGLDAETIAGAVLRVFGPDVSALQNGGRVPLRADGTAPLLVGGSCLVELCVPGLARSSRLLSPGTATMTFHAGELAAAPAGTLVRGRVRTATGKPVGDLRLFVRDRSRCDVAAIAVGRDGSFAERFVLPADGICRFGLALGDWLFTGEEDTIADAFTWTPVWNANAPIDLCVEPAGTLRCVLQAKGGVRFALADVVVADSANPERPLVRTCSDRDGSVHLGLPEGDHDLLAVTHDGKVIAASVRIVPGTVRAPEWRAVPAGEVAGCVRAAAGRPVAGVELVALAHATHDSLRAGERQRCTAVTDRNGRFRCRGLPAGGWTIAPLHDERARMEMTTVVADQVSSVDLAYVR